MTRRYRRRTVLGAGALAVAGALAGCTTGWRPDRDAADGTAPERGSTDDSPAVPDVPRVTDPPDAVYIPTHREGMRHLQTVEAGEYALSPMLTYPHPFWLVTGSRREEVVPADGRGVHLMVTLWDAETGQVLPVDAGTELRVLQDGDIVDRRAPWPMISQTMGFHFGDNVALPEDGEYTVEVDLNPIQTPTTGAFADRFEEPRTAAFSFTYDDEFRREVVERIEYLDEDLWGRRGALEPPDHGGHDDDSTGDDHDDSAGGHGGHEDDSTGDDHTDSAGGHGGHEDDSTDGHGGHDGDADDHHVPFSSLPPAGEYPGRHLGVHESGDARFVVRYVEDSRFTGGSGGYLIVSPRTPYNRVPLADVALSVEGAVESRLEQTLDEELGLLYGAALELSPGDALEVVVDAPPQVARHAGYETAFLEMSSMTVEVPE